MKPALVLAGLVVLVVWVLNLFPGSGATSGDWAPPVQDSCRVVVKDTGNPGLSC